MGCVMSRRRRSAPSPAAVPALPDDMLREIFVRFPAHPASLRRVSLACTEFRGLVTDGLFMREFRGSHGNAPPLVGLFHNYGVQRFLPSGGGGCVRAASRRAPPSSLLLGPHDPDWEWSIVCVRHGRVLLRSPDRLRLLVLEPASGRRHYLHAPTEYGPSDSSNAAVVCAGGHAVHDDCRSSHFLVVFVTWRHQQALVSTYSSRTGAWTAVASAAASHAVDPRPGVLIGSVLYVGLVLRGMLAIDLAKREVREVVVPMAIYDRERDANLHVVASRAGEVRLLAVRGLDLQLWVPQTFHNGLPGWEMPRVVCLGALLRIRAPSAREERPVVFMAGFDEDAAVAFLWTKMGVFGLQIDTMRLEKVLDKCGRMRTMYPYKSFFWAAGTPNNSADGGVKHDEQPGVTIEEIQSEED